MKFLRSLIAPFMAGTLGLIPIAAQADNVFYIQDFTEDAAPLGGLERQTPRLASGYFFQIVKKDDFIMSRFGFRRGDDAPFNTIFPLIPVVHGPQGQLCFSTTPLKSGKSVSGKMLDGDNAQLLFNILSAPEYNPGTPVKAGFGEYDCSQTQFKSPDDEILEIQAQSKNPEASRVVQVYESLVFRGINDDLAKQYATKPNGIYEIPLITVQSLYPVLQDPQNMLPAGILRNAEGELKFVM